ncbi:MAG: transporter substrate-binding domain-containing protein [Lachnospiraceae bacterium]|nr:transporter substrate-binding domain-containing protein [Lachnospiraceae bacterium]
MKKRLIAAILSSVMVFSLAACGSSTSGSASPDNASQDNASSGSASSESDLSYIKEKGTLMIGITDFAPMDYKDDSGNWIGFDADTAVKIAESLGVEAQFVEIDWDNKILELNNKSIDVVWNGMTLTDEVKNSMECTNPYMNNAQVVVVPAADADKYTDAASLSGLSFAVEAGSAGEAAAGENGFDYTAVSAQSDAVMEVSAGTSGACIIDLLMAGAMVGEGTSYADLTHTVELTSEEYVIGCRKGSDLASYINDQLKKMYGDGSLVTIAETYGVQEALLPQK